MTSSLSMMPSFRKTFLFVCAATSGSWVTMMMVFPWLLISCRSFIMSWVVLLSKAPVGSSARIILGSVIKALAMATLCFCPPES